VEVVEEVEAQEVVVVVFSFFLTRYSFDLMAALSRLRLFSTADRQ
jgi:hypothetical protein